MPNLDERSILNSWKRNVSPWIKAVQGKEIESRRVVTDEAIVRAVSSLPARNILDVGCGEGWLVRELSHLGFLVTGIDATSGLVEKAKEFGSGTFHVMEYENLSIRKFKEKFDAVVCNFSLLGKESVEHVFKVAPEILHKRGAFIVQTLHPHVSCGSYPYIDGWREGSWEGFSEEFVDPAPWYYRTLESWAVLYSSNGMKITAIQEPINPFTGKVTSLLMVGVVST